MLIKRVFLLFWYRNGFCNFFYWSNNHCRPWVILRRSSLKSLLSPQEPLSENKLRAIPFRKHTKHRHCGLIMRAISGLIMRAISASFTLDWHAILSLFSNEKPLGKWPEFDPTAIIKNIIVVFRNVCASKTSFHFIEFCFKLCLFVLAKEPLGQFPHLFYSC